MQPNKIILASNNQHKLEELSNTLAPINVELISQASLNIDSADETGLSFIENALIKARHASHLTNKPAIADDSGLVVPSLKGEPGIYSSRYSGAHANDQSNIDYLLTNMINITKRDAYFYCALVYIKNANDPAPLIGIGKFRGEIVKSAIGTHGFGYDPIFFIPELGQTAAELTQEKKNKISHRAIASQHLLKLMQSEGF